MAKVAAQQILPFLWFDANAEEAAKFYVSVFKKNSKILNVARRPKNVPGPKGNPLVVAFLLNGQKFLAMNGGPSVKFNQGVSFVVHCKDQKEIDYFWKSLSKGGKEIQCSWLQDKYGLYWQIVPARLVQLLGGTPAQTARVMDVVMKSVKLDVKAMEKAFRG